MFSIGERIRYGHSTPVSATLGRMLGQSQGASRQIGARGGGLWDDVKALALQRHFWVRNAPYVLADRCKSLKSQQMRPPSERTTIFYSAPFFCAT
jgi:hypothetical protein